ncbi:hypothetical protein [Streptomyces fagopyri]|uniref:hypothetical protein n=1 Tax=Streptomyces fagopyri TaxID=2662397 RepID=UPI00382F0279
MTMTAGAAFVGALALTLSAASPAAADDSWQQGTRTSDQGSAALYVDSLDKARVCFNPTGDTIYVYDGDACSASTVADWENYKHWNDISVYRSGSV